MAESIVGQDLAPPCAAPDAVFVQCTPPIEQDLHALRAFGDLLAVPTYTYRNKVCRLVERTDAVALLEFARARRSSCDRSARLSYSVLLRNLPRAIQEADERAELLRSDRAKKEDGAYREHWTGTRAQLTASLGLPLTARFPTGRGGDRQSSTTDSRGWNVSICLLGPQIVNWGVFEAYVEYPVSVLEARRAEKRAAGAAQKQQIAELQQLKFLPATKQAFRDREAARFHRFIDLVLTYLQPEAGYRFSNEAKEEFLEACCDAYQVLKSSGEVIGESPAAALQRVVSQQAKRNAPLQDFLARVTTQPIGDEA